MKTTKYKQYKKSKTLWLSEIPAHWQGTSIKAIFIENKIKNTNLIENNLLSLSYGRLKRKDINDTKGLVPLSFEGYQVIEKGFIVLRFTDLQNDKKSLRVGYCNEKGIITNAYIGLMPKESIHSKYYYYLLHYLDIIKYYYNLGDGVRQSLSYKDFSREIILRPKLEEQKQISDFLDYKIGLIEAITLKKGKLIKLLLERINTYIQKSEEGVEYSRSFYWPYINNNWKLEKAKRVFKEIKIVNYPNEELLAVTQKRGVIPKKFCEEKYVVATTGLRNQKLVAEDDFVISLRSFQGGIEHSKYKGIVSPAYTVIRLREKYYKPHLIIFYKYLFKTKQFISELNTVISGIRDGKNISWIDFSDLIIPIPTLKGIKNLRDYVDTYEKQKDIYQKEKRYLLEYKDALIFEAVTGKIDLREYVIPRTTEEEKNYEEIEEEQQDLELEEEDLENYQLKGKG